MARVAPVAVRELPLVLRRRILMTYCGFFVGVYCLGVISWIRDTHQTDFRGELAAESLSILGLLLCLRRPLMGWRYVLVVVCLTAAPVAALFFHYNLAAQVWSLIPLMFLGIFVRTWHGKVMTGAYIAIVGVASTAGLLLAPEPAPALWPVLFVLSIAGAVGVFGLSQAALREAADRDPLTGVWNRAGVIWQAEALASRSRGRRRPMAAIVLDLDDFKVINDNDGHEAGDKVLVDLAGRWQAQIPRDAIIGRLGGDEFVVLLSGYDLDSAREVAATLSAGPVHVTAGIAAGPFDGAEDLTPLLAAADEDLYRNKRERKTPTPE